MPRSFFDRHPSLVAPDLLGKVVVHGGVALRLTEVEAYGGPGEDPAAHTYRGMTPRNAVMFGPPGHLYVYFTYGMHFCANLVCLGEGHGSAVLLRGGEIVAGIETARARRGAVKPVPDRDLARGPARLAVAMGFSRPENGIDMIGSVFDGAVPDKVSAGPRTGISTAMEVPWRFWIEGDPTVSPYRRHVPRRRQPGPAGRAQT
ncbi:DNA-3-methyladenine glycosylase [Nonomuraea soli]|uniref:Putative 3-methyladenine DNA glycosylase n=1 Tax=Nonomuraea soli TaxID=1032476 RepID=A0A7W0HTJ9_9ACTN|nr:DNA-3-methyladenine glycosylase [Nonomuraea soli]MBA2895194.1 DNA-3-methyladenine glycosylase [Nonomuraea soli]